VRVVQVPGWPPIFLFNLLRLFIEIHAVGVTSCGNGFSRTRTTGFFLGILAVRVVSYASSWPEIYLGTMHNDVECLGGSKRIFCTSRTG
jgi:hypothetical protein